VWRDKTSYLTSKDSIDTTMKTVSGNYCKIFSAIQRSNQKLWPFWAVITVWLDNTSSSTSRDSICTIRKTASGNCCRTLSAIQRSNQKLWPFWAVITIWRDNTSSSTSRDSICTTWKTASGNYRRTLSAIQRSDQKLWPFQGKRSPETTYELWVWSNCWIKRFGPFKLLLQSGATIPPLQRVGIP
jgi:hypothetical protein